MIGKTILHYKILSKLGEGGMGVVYKAEDTKLKRVVAIKFLPRHIARNGDERRRFKVEAQAAAALNHPNISTIHAIEDLHESGGPDQDEMFIVMEFIDGKELKHIIADGPLSVDEATDITIQIARGLEAAHKRGIIHRDIKSTNIMQIADALMVKLAPTEKVVLEKRATLNSEAFDCYLRARDFLYRRTKKGAQFAIELFQKAVELDPRYAEAYAGLGEAYATLHYDYGAEETLLDKAIDSSLKALVYNPTLSEAYVALGLSYLSKSAMDEALEAIQKAIELGSENFAGYWILGRIYHTTDRDKEAVDQLKKAIALNPDFHTAYIDLRMVYERLGDKKNHRELVEKTLNEVYPRYLMQHPDDARAHIFYAVDLAQYGKTEQAKVEAEKALELSPDDTNMTYNAACFYARLGESKLSVKALKDAMAGGFKDFEWIKRDPDLDSIRKEPGYINLMKGK